MITPEQAIVEADKALDRFLDNALASDVRLMVQLGATKDDVKVCVARQRQAYAETKRGAMASIAAFLLDATYCDGSTNLQ